MADFASVTRLTQTGFNEGIQELNVYMDNDTAIPQQWKWPDCRHEGDAGSFSLHDVYVRLFEAGMEPDELYLFVTTAAKQVGGKTLSQAAPQPAAETTEETTDETGGDTGDGTEETGGDGTGSDETTADETGGDDDATSAKTSGDDEDSTADDNSDVEQQEEEQQEDEDEKKE